MHLVVGFFLLDKSVPPYHISVLVDADLQFMTSGAMNSIVPWNNDNHDHDHDYHDNDNNCDDDDDAGVDVDTASLLNSMLSSSPTSKA